MRCIHLMRWWAILHSKFCFFISNWDQHQIRPIERLILAQTFHWVFCSYNSFMCPRALLGLDTEFLFTKTLSTWIIRDRELQYSRLLNQLLQYYSQWPNSFFCDCNGVIPGTQRSSGEFYSGFLSALLLPTIVVIRTWFWLDALSLLWEFGYCLFDLSSSDPWVHSLSLSWWFRLSREGDFSDRLLSGETFSLE